MKPLNTTAREFYQLSVRHKLKSTFDERSSCDNFVSWARGFDNAHILRNCLILLPEKFTGVSTRNFKVRIME